MPNNDRTTQIKKRNPQCARCQRYGHSKSYYHPKARCMKCAGVHLSHDCTRKGRSNNVKCVLCEGNHPANYKGCKVYKELQNAKYPSLRQKQAQYPSPKKTHNRHTQYDKHEERTEPGVTYAQVSNNNKNNNDNEDISTQSRSTQITNKTKNIQKIGKLLKDLMKQMDLLASCPCMFFGIF